jgi:hypothetical protein
LLDCLFGNAFGGVGIPFCIHKAEQAAEEVIQTLQPSAAQ